VSIILFVFAAVYGLHNGANLYHDQISEIDNITSEVDKEITEITSYYDKENPSPEGRSWVDLTLPDWAIWYTKILYFKKPSPGIVYSIGQAEQYGYYKILNYMSSPYDSDMTKEIANLERLQIGTLDFAFSLIFLLPLLLIILLHNLRSMEAEQGFLNLIEIQVSSNNIWILSKVFFYTLVTYLVLILLLFYGATLTNVLVLEFSLFSSMILYTLIYLMFWTGIYYFIVKNGISVTTNTLKMVGIWLMFTFIIPAVIHQYVTIQHPTNLMTDYIEVSRDKKNDLYDQPDTLLKQMLIKLFPEVSNAKIPINSKLAQRPLNESRAALANDLFKQSIQIVEAKNKVKNDLIRSTFLYNPITFFQNKFNQISRTHYLDYNEYRHEIQTSIDSQNRTMVLDSWNDVRVDKKRYLNYYEKFSVKIE
jgi:ABC-2 type transport system permease protein